MPIYHPSRVVILCLVLAGCSGAPHSSSDSEGRRPATLDNNGEPVDDSFDPNLESYFGGSRDHEMKSNAAVAEVIRQSVEAQYKVRAQVANSEARSSSQAKRIFSDLPKPIYATRDVHRKTQGCYKAELKVAPELKDGLNRQIESYLGTNEVDRRLSRIGSESELGVFGGAERYDAIVRFSNGNPGNRPDRLPDARGFAVKLLPADTLGGAELSAMDPTLLNQKTTLDILSINFPTFFMNDPERYAKFNKVALESGLDFKNKLIGKSQEFWSVFVSGELTALERKLTLFVNGSVIYSPLYQEYFSMVPSRLGPMGSIRSVKYSWVPASCAADRQSRDTEESQKQWAPWTRDHSYAFPPRSPKEVVDPRSKSEFSDDYLRVHTRDRLLKDDFCFDLYFQLYRDQLSTNIEDATDIWLRSEQERSWWLNEVIPGKLLWETSPFNTESRDNYIRRVSAKKIATPVRAAQLKIRRLDSLEGSKAGTNDKTCEDLSFNPWNGNIAFHKPLGVVSRMKRKVYNASRRERHKLNGVDDQGVERQ